MNWDWLFLATNIVAFTAWLALAALPRNPRILAAILYVGVLLLCFAYAAMFVALFGDLADPGRVAGAPPVDVGNYSIAGIRALFMSDGGIVLGWTHYLAFDLFVGLWIARDADNKRFGRLVQLPFLFATLMAGPIGLLAWLILRERRARAMAKARAAAE